MKSDPASALAGASRQDALLSHALLDAPEPDFDALVRLAAGLCELPIALIGLVDDRHRWIKATVGLQASDIDPALALCSIGMAQPGITAVPDLAQDPRFANHPLVTGGLGLRSFAGASLQSSEGDALGMLAVLGLAPHSLSDLQTQALANLARQVMLQLGSRRQRQALLDLGQEREQILATVRQQAEVLQIAGRLARVGGWVADLSERTLVCSAEAAAIHELARAPVTLTDALACYAPEWRELLDRLFRRCAKQGLPFDAELELITAGGRRVWVRCMGQAERDERGRIVRIQGALQDISERRDAQRTLQQSQRRFRQLADAMPQIVWTAEPDGRVDYVNKAAFAYTALAADAAGAPVDWLSAVHPDDRSATAAAWETSVRDGSPFQVEYRLRRATEGQDRWMLVHAEPTRDEEGRIVKWYGTTTDIHDRKLSEQRAAGLAERLTATLENITDGYFTLDADWRFSDVNSEALRLFGRESTELIGKICWDVFPAEVGGVFEREYRRAMSERRPIGFEAQSSVRKHWFEVRAAPWDEGLVVYFRDVTERRSTLEALRRSEERFKHVARATTDSIWDWDLVTNEFWRNEGFLSLFGNEASEVEAGIVSWRGRIHPDDLARVNAGVEAVIDGTANNWSDEFRFRRRDGSYAVVLDRGFLIRDETGQAVRMIGGMSDLSERRAAAEEARREEAMRVGILRMQQEIASTTLDSGALMQSIIERACALTGATGGDVVLREGEDLVCRAAWGQTAGVELGLPVSRVRSLAMHAARAGELQYSAETLGDPRVNQERCHLVGTRSLLAAPLRLDKEVFGVLSISSTQPGAFGSRELASVQILVESLGAVIERRRFAERLQASEAQYRLLFEHNPQPMWVADAASHRLLAVNRRAMAHYGYSEAEFLAMRVEQLCIPADQAQSASMMDAAIDGRRINELMRHHHRRDGSVIEVEVSSDAIDFNGQPARLFLATDVTERSRAERELARLNRAQRLLSACNEALIRADAEPELLQRICQLTVDIGGYMMAFVGLSEEGTPYTVRPVAHAGQATAYLDGWVMSWTAETAPGRGNVGRTIASGRATVVESIADDPMMLPWRERALEHGLQALVTLPLRAGDATFGVLVLYSPEPNSPSADEVALLDELANDLAFGIINLRALAERGRLQAAVLNVSTAVSRHSGEAFFDTLVHHMVEAVGAQAGFVARIDPRDPGIANTLSGEVDGVATGAMRYALEGTPCATLMHTDTCLVLDRLEAQFPLARSLHRAGAQSLVGCRLNGAAGLVLGLLFVWFRTPLRHGDFVASTLQIFAARAAAEMERLDADARLRDQASLLDKAQDAIIVHGIDERISYWNRSAERLYGWTSVQAIGRSVRGLLYRDAEALRLATAQLLTDGEWTGEIEQQRQDGSLITVEGRWSLVRDAAGEPQSVLGIHTDISQRKEAERAVHRLAFYDALTGLPNRLLLIDRLEQGLSAGARSGRRGALLFIDLDNFKTLNDTLGHDRGDLLLQQVAQRLNGCVREVDTVARFGGDEFLVMLQELSEQPELAANQARAIAQKILDTLSQPYLLDAHEHRCTSSIGIAPFLGHEHGAGELLKQTDLAMYQAKAAGRNAMRFFDPQMQAAVSKRASLEADLRLALAQQQFVLHYQPQADAQGRTIGVEALVRWRHPQRGMVSPADFIALAEETGQILALGQWVLETACHQLASWRALPQRAGLSISVNVSSRQFHHPDFVEQVTTALRSSAAPAECLKLELTESLLVHDMQAIIAKMELLKSLGVGFSLDDFGTGYSSLAYLKRLPLDQLKIDQSFVRDVFTDPNDAAIARTIVALGHSLGLNVIAEGVETPEQRDLLLQQGCHGYQGYFLSRPLGIEQLEAWLD